MRPFTSRGCCVLLLLCGLPTIAARPQSPQPAYTIPVSVYEVNLIFSASDFEGIPIEDLTLSDLRLLDNGKQQRQILKFEHRTGLPLRAGIVVDTSRSMLGALRRNRLITAVFASKILRSSSDQSFVLGFDFEAKLLHDWTSNADDLQMAMHQLGQDAKSRLGGSAVYDSVYRAVRDQFARQPSLTTGTGNLILLFSDGGDNASHAYLQDVVDICQQTHTTIYVFSDSSKSRFDTGQKNLRELAARTGGRIFYDEDPVNALKDLRTIESELRNSYLIAYKPSSVKPDGKFHSINLTSPTRGGIITTRSGYYAPKPSR
ncbi:MAG TPA: VWA domain-containing protein [Edaphobacter sp.]|nr:VWA domain-containing protein [Edaphobacter sp.]